MEKNTFRNILLVVGLMALGLFMYVMYSYFQERDVNWSEDYRTQSKEPYNNFVFVELLKSYFSEHDFIVADELLTKIFEEKQDKEKHTTYVFVGSSPHLIKSETEALLKFVEDGNTAFFANMYIYSGSTDSLFSVLFDYSDIENYFIQDSILHTNFIAPTLTRSTDFNFAFEVDKALSVRHWLFFDTQMLQDLGEGEQVQVEVLDHIRNKNGEISYDSYDKDGITSWTSSEENFTGFVRIKYGKGYFYFHRNPILFTNYYLIQEEGKAYTERVLSYFPEGDIIWDEASHRYKREDGYVSKQQNMPSPLSYILAQPSLAWAYYTLIASVILFVIFRGKRLQRAIPIMHKEANTSLEFVQTIGHLYFAQKNHQRLAQLKVRLFFDFVRSHYHLPTQTINEDFRAKLIQRSGLDKEFIDNLIDDLLRIQQNQNTSEWFLRKLHTQIHDFYTHCK